MKSVTFLIIIMTTVLFAGCGGSSPGKEADPVVSNDSQTPSNNSNDQDETNKPVDEPPPVTGACDNGADKSTYYRDADGDTYGALASSVEACSLPAGYVTNSTDCDDANAGVKPGAVEICDGVDNNCDGDIDEGLVKTVYYHDADSDGYGSVADSIQACSVPAGYVTNSTDCNDANAAIRPGATEVCDSVDNNCNGVTDEGVKNTYYRDADADTYGALAVTTQACIAPAGYVTNSTDCNDANAAIKPGATEVCDGVDNDCDTSIDEGVKNTYYRDADGDTYGALAVTTQACTQPAGYVANSTDCDDTNDSANPGGIEICDEIDNDCNGKVDDGLSAASKGFGNLFATTPTDIGTGLPGGYEPSGVVWHPRLNKLFTISDGGIITSMNVDGTNVVNKTIGGDFEGVTVADPDSNFIYIGVEQPRDSILEYNVVSQTVTRTFYVDAYMVSANANAGLEALTFEPDITSDEGGYFYAGLQENGAVYVFELPIKTSTSSTSVNFIDSFSTHYSGDISDMYYDPIDDVLYAIYDSANKLVSMQIDGTFIAEWVLPLNDQEGFALDDTCHVYVGEDTGSVWSYQNSVDYS